MQAPPAALIFFSANLEKKRALTTIGTFGRRPFPKTLNTPFCVQSKTGAFPLALACSKTSSPRIDQSLSTLATGQKF